MILYRAATVWSLFFVLGFAHIQVWGGVTDGEIEDLLIQAKRQRSQSQPHLQRRDDTDYVTRKEFNDTMDSINNRITGISKDVTDLQKKYTDLDTAVANDVTKDDFNKAGGSWQGQINEIAANLSKLNKNVSAIQSTLDKDHCADSPCKNQGTCLNRLDGYLCVCKAGYGGTDCQNVGDWGLSAVLTVDNGGDFGDWGKLAMCPPGSFARTFRIQLEDRLGVGKDDSCMNNIELYCRDPVQNKDTSYISSGTGPFGEWQGWQNCPDGEFLTGFKLKVEEFQGSGTGYDDTSANGITMTCSGGAERTGPINEWGKYGSTAKCPKGHSICGVSSRIEPNQGSGDDTALNDIIMICCSSW